MATVDQSNPFPFNGMIAFSAPGQLGDHYLRADGQTIVDPGEYPLVTTVLNPTLPDILALEYSSDLALYVCADGGNGSGDNTVKSIGFWWSTNGSDWNLGTSWQDLGVAYAAGDSLTIRQIRFANGIFVAVGLHDYSSNNHGIVCTSVDGKTWSLAKTVSTNGTYFNGVAFGNDLWIAAGAHISDGLDYVSDDNGATWTVGNYTQASSPANGIAYSDTLTLFAIATAGGKIYTSADDAAWTGRTTDTGVETRDVIWNAEGAKFAATGDDTKIYTSTNGTAWTGASYTGATSLGKIRYSADNNLYIGVDSAATIYSSTNLTAWTLRYTPTGGAVIEDIIADPCTAGVDIAVQFASSANGTTWTENTGPGVTAFVSPYIGFRDINDDTFNAGIYIKYK